MASNKKLVLIGGGGHCKSVIDAALRMGVYDEIVITDPELEVGERILGCIVVGNDEILPKLKENGFRFAAITIGSIKTTTVRRRLFDRASSIGFIFPSIIDPDASVSGSAQMGMGCFVGKNAVVNADTIINDFAIVNSGAIVEHECKIGKFSHLSVGSVLCGNVVLEDDVFVGAGTTVIQGLCIGKKSIIGAGSLILSNVMPASSIIGLHKNGGVRTIDLFLQPQREAA